MTPRTKTDMIVIHCASTPASMDIGVKEIKKWHVEDNKWDDIGYHYVIRRDGTLEIRGHASAQSHLKFSDQDGLFGQFTYDHQGDNNNLHYCYHDD